MIKKIILLLVCTFIISHAYCIENPELRQITDMHQPIRDAYVITDRVSCYGESISDSKSAVYGLFLGHDDPIPVGMISLSQCNISNNCEDYYYESMIDILPIHQNKGYGKTLCEKVAELYQKDNGLYIYANTEFMWGHHYPALAVHLNGGYKIVGFNSSSYCISTAFPLTYHDMDYWSEKRTSAFKDLMKIIYKYAKKDEDQEYTDFQAQRSSVRKSLQRPEAATDLKNLISFSVTLLRDMDFHKLSDVVSFASIYSNMHDILPSVESKDMTDELNRFLQRNLYNHSEYKDKTSIHFFALFLQALKGLQEKTPLLFERLG